MSSSKNVFFLIFFILPITFSSVLVKARSVTQHEFLGKDTDMLGEKKKKQPKQTMNQNIKRQII